jgi:hypothetical protein
MFCPKCGVQIVETTKFCKSCGLALAPMTDFVARGGIAPFGGSWLSNALSGFSSGQKVWLASLALIFSPVIAPILMLAVPFLAPIAVVRMLLQYKLQKSYLTAQPPVQPPVPQGYFQQPQIQPAQIRPAQANLLYEAPTPAPQTGSLISEAAPASVVYDETRRLRNQLFPFGVPPLGVLGPRPHKGGTPTIF